jgi:hypothetical protein
MDPTLLAAEDDDAALDDRRGPRAFEAKAGIVGA